jgi:hypothetical protein
MAQQIPFSNPKINKGISPEQLNEIVEAILAGKYSWACVLLLRYAGYNPLHYIPYRTYNRLLKENCQIGRPSEGETNKIDIGKKSAQTKSKGTTSGKHLSLISDLTYVEDISEQDQDVRGGNQDLEFKPLHVIIQRLKVWG